MSLDNDLNALGAIVASETREPSDEVSEAKVSEAVANTDPESIEGVLVDFERLQAEQDRTEGLAIAAERLRTDGKIDMLTAQSLASISKTILGTDGNKAVYTEVGTKVGLKRAIESLTSEEEAARSQIKHASGNLIARAGKTAQGQMETLKSESRSALLSFARTLANFNDEYFSVNLRDVTLNDGEINFDQILNMPIALTDPFYGEQSLFAACKPMLTKLLMGADIAPVARWINADKHYIALDNKLIDIEQAVDERSFDNSSNFYPEDQAKPKLGEIVQAGGSPSQADYEAVLVAGITEGVYQLQQFLNQETDEIKPDVDMSRVIYLTKVISAMVRAYQASVTITKVCEQLHQCLLCSVKSDI